MKFKDFMGRLKDMDVKEQILGYASSNLSPANPDGAIDTPETNISSLTGASLNKLNAFLGAAFSKSYISPENVLDHIKNKLSIFGLQFDYRLPPAKTGASLQGGISSDSARGPIRELGEGIHEFPLTYLGGSYGRHPTDPGYEPYHSDNITRKVGTPLVLCVSIVRNENSTYTVKPVIISR